MYLPKTLSFDGSGNIVLRGAEDIIAARVEPITKRAAGDWYFTEPDISNARLFAAAPDLLHALQRMIYWHENNKSCGKFNRDLAQARAIYRQATNHDEEEDI